MIQFIVEKLKFEIFEDHKSKKKEWNNQERD
jgi:hypothetical protein